MVTLVAAQRHSALVRVVSPPASSTESRAPPSEEVALLAALTGTQLVTAAPPPTDATLCFIAATTFPLSSHAIIREANSRVF